MHEKISSRLEENISNYIFDKGLTLKYLNKLRNSTIRQPTNNFFFFSCPGDSNMQSWLCNININTRLTHSYSFEFVWVAFWCMYLQMTGSWADISILVLLSLLFILFFLGTCRFKHGIRYQSGIPLERQNIQCKTLIFTIKDHKWKCISACLCNFKLMKLPHLWASL